MYSNLNKHLLLFTDCIVLEGYLNNIIFDFSRESNSSFLPKSYINFIENCKQYTLKEIFDFSEQDDFEIITDYIEFTLKKELGFLCDIELLNSFPPLGKIINSPEYIDNCIVEILNFDIQYLNKISSIIDDLMITHVELRIFNINISDLENLIQIFGKSIVESISLYIDILGGNQDKCRVEALMQQYLRIKKVVLFNQIKEGNNDKYTLIFKEQSLNKFLEQTIPLTRNLNLSFHLESQNVNPYLYKKMFIDISGNIRISEDVDLVFGNINEISSSNEIINVVNGIGYKSLWNSPKNKIQVCKDCEYQTVCFDTRIPQKVNDSTTYYFKNECVYNPYIGKTKGEEGYRPLAECGVISNENGFSIDHEKIAEINKELWEEEDVTD